MTRGDQRDRDRAKAQAKAADKAKQKGREGDPLKRNENDAAALQAKIAAKKAASESTTSSSSSSSAPPVVRKKVPTKKMDTLDDVLNAGLNAVKKSGGGGKVAAK